MFQLQLNHAAVLNAIPRGPENQKRKKVMVIKNSVIKKNKQKIAVKTQKKLKNYQFSHKPNLKKKMFMI